MKRSFNQQAVLFSLILTTAFLSEASQGQVLPGTGVCIETVGDNFEAQPDWNFIPNYPKSSRNIDKQERGPLGYSNNGRWLDCLLYTSPSPRDGLLSRMPSSA